MKIDRTKALIAGVLITISAHSQASLINFTSPISSLSSSLTGTFTYDTDLDRYSNVNLTYDLANSNVQTIRALTSDGPNSASTISVNFFREGRLTLQQGTEFKLTFVGLGGLGVPGTITWSSITDILVVGRGIRNHFIESGAEIFTVTNLSSTELPPTEPPSEVPLPSTVPLPSALAMFASGLVAFAGYRRRKQQT